MKLIIKKGDWVSSSLRNCLFQVPTYIIEIMNCKLYIVTFYFSTTISDKWSHSIFFVANLIVRSDMIASALLCSALLQVLNRVIYSLIAIVIGGYTTGPLCPLILFNGPSFFVVLSLQYNNKAQFSHASGSPSTSLSDVRCQIWNRSCYSLSLSPVSPT